ncbi:MAG: hypothetical protein ACRBN8_41825 [Nannocystales bacterium]
MVDRDAPTTAGPVVICCAGADGDTIRPVVEDLEGQGHTVTLLEGVETSPASLGPAVERLHGEGLYVLCRSKALGRSAVDELRDILLAHHVPFGRTLTVASTRPRELRERIGASLRRLASGKARRMSGVSPDGPSLRTTRLGVKPPPIPGPSSAEAESQPDAPGVSRSTRVGLPPTDPGKPAAPLPARAPAPQPSTRVGLPPTDPSKTAGPLPTRAPTPKPAAPPPPPVASNTIPKPKTVPPVATDVEDDPFEPEAPANLTPAVEEEPDALLAEPPVEPLIRPDDLADLDDADAGEAERQPAPPPVRTGSTTVTPVIPRSTLDAIRTGDTAIVSRDTLLAAGLDDQDGPAPPPAPPAAPPPSEATLGPPELTGGTVRATAAVLATDTTTDSGEAKQPPWLWISVGAAALLLLTIVAFAIGGSDDEADGDTTLAKAEAEAAKDSSRRADPDTKPPEAEDDAPDSLPAGEEPQQAVGEGPTRIGHALRTRAIRALDVLLVSNTEGPLSWEAAKEHCGGLELGGLSTWRLPAVGELMSLTQAQMTKRGYYWSATPADTFGDQPLVWYAKRSRVVTRGRDNLVLCVRGGSKAG